MPSPRRKPVAPTPGTPRLWNIRNAAATGEVPVIELFGDIGVSREPDWFWGGEGGAGTFQEFAEELKALGNVPELRVEIHSYGGSVVVGKAMHDKLAEHPANKTAIIYGICASAATYPALACQTVKIPANSFFLIHNSHGCCCGGAGDMRAMAEMLDIADESIANLYAARTGKTVEEIQEIMDKDTWMTGAQAVAIGLADEVVDPIKVEKNQQAAPDNFSRAALNGMPKDARAWFDISRLPTANSAPPTMLNMFPRSPLLNAATSAPAAGGGTSPTATPPAPSASNAGPAGTTGPTSPVGTPGPAAPPSAAAPAPLTLENMKDLLKEQLAPMENRIKELEGLRNAGVGSQAWGNQPPVEGVKTGGEAEPQNEAELKTALAKCKNHGERRALIAAYDARKTK